MKHRLAALAVFALLVFSMLPMVVLPAHASGPTVNHVATNATTNVASIAVTLTVDTAADVVIVAAQAIDGFTVNPDIHSISVTDGGDTFTEQVFKTVTIGVSCAAGLCIHSAIWSATAATAGSKTVTVTFDHGSPSGESASIEAWDTTGFGATAASTATGSATGSTSVTTSTSNAFVAPALAIGSETGCSASNCVAGTSYTLACFDAAAFGACGEYSTTVASPTNYRFSQAGSTNWTDAGAIFSSVITMVVTIMNFDLGNYLVVPLKKFYNFNETVIGVNHATVDVIKWKWTDGANIAEVQYSNITKTATVLQGDNIIQIGTPTVTSSIVSGQRRLQVIIPVRLTDNALDTTNVGIQAFAQSSDGVARGYIFVRNNYFNILNQGGGTSQQISGSCATVAGAPTFGALCQDPGWIMTNTTWFQLQHYHTEFAINLNDNFGNPDVFLFQDFANSNAGAEHYTAKGDWKVDIGWFYFNNGAWMKGFHMTIQMDKGNQGVQDQWTQLRILFYNGKNTLIGNGTSNILNSWIEQSPRSQIRLWADIWLSDINSSSMHGMRVGSYYYAIHQSGFTFFGTWSPFLQNASSAMSFYRNIDSTGKTLNAQQIQYSKLYFNISRGHHPIGQANFQVFTRDFNLENFKRTIGTMTGLSTPIFVDARIPTLPADGFLAPLFQAITNIGNFIWSALSAAFAAIWAQIGIRFPWFTGFWNTVIANVTNFGNLFIGIMQQLGGFLSFLFSIFSFATIPIQIVVNAWTFISNAFNTVFPGASLGQWTTLFLIAVVGVSFFEAAVTGDWPWMIRFAKQTWGIMNAIMFWTYYFAKVIIDAVLAIIP